MFNISDISLSLSYSALFLFLGIILIFSIVYFYYKDTIPVIDKKIKIFLAIIRFIVLTTILFLIFEPLLLLKIKNEIKPKGLVFFDNSSSIIAKDSLNKKELLNKILLALKNDINGDVEYFTFGKNVNVLEKLGLKYNEGTTNFIDIIDFIQKQTGNIASVNIISDGIINEGSNPINAAVRLGIPVNTLAIGDTSADTDVYISKIITGDYLYTKTTTNIEVTVNNHNLGNEPVKVTLYEDGKLVTSNNLILSNEGINKINFDYTPNNIGDTKLTCTVSQIKKDNNKQNNSLIKIVEVLDSKVKVVLLSSIPSNDVSFIKNSLTENENFEVTLIQQAGSIIIGTSEYNKSLDSADILILVNFPAQNTNNEILSKVLNKIDNGKPFLYIMGEGTDFSKLKLFEKYLPFSVKSYSNSKISVQAYVNDNNSALLKSNNPLYSNIWNNLPPVLRFSGEFISKPESQILLKAKVANTVTEMPLLLNKSLGKKRTIAILANEIWRWKLNAVKESELVFNSLINESVKWLNVASEQKQLNVKTVKQVYGKAEEIEFFASAYDETYNPLENAEITIKAKRGNAEYETITEPLGNGLYKATLNISEPGYYNYTATGNYKGKIIGTDTGKFSIGEIDLEKINLKQDRDLLLSLSGNTGGKFFESNNYNDFIKNLNLSLQNSDKFIYTNKEIKLWNLETVLVLIILLLAIEWIIRKKLGLL